MKVLVLLRGITPVGKNKIPKMSYLCQILVEAGFINVKTHIQSGNIILQTDMNHIQLAKVVHDIILEKIGADLSVIIKSIDHLFIAIEENPFDESHDFSRIHLVFTNDEIETNKINIVKNTLFEDEIFMNGKECLYMYLPKDAKKKKLNNNYLEKKLNIVTTTRKLNVIMRLRQMLQD